MIRFIIRMKDPIDKACLEYVAGIAMGRHLVFRLVVVSDDKRFYLKKNTAKPVIHCDDDSRHIV